MIYPDSLSADFLCYTSFVAKKPLIETNPYLRDPKQYEKLLLINVTSSTAVELGQVPASIVRALKDSNLPRFIKIEPAPSKSS